MDLSNISQGQIIKNYKELCTLLNEQTKTGTSKIAQLKEWERYFTYSKDGNKYIINEVYSIPKPKEDKRIHNGGIRKILPHAVRMDRVLMYKLNQEEKGELFLPIISLLKEMNMINSNYNLGKRNIQKTSKYLNIEEATLEEFFDYSTRTLKNNIESMLDRLRNRAMLFWSKVITVCIAHVHIAENDLGKLKAKVNKIIDRYQNEKIKVSAKENTILSYRAATKEEIELILKIEGETLNKYNCKSKQEIILKGKWNDFINEIHEILFNRANILYYYDSYRIIRNEERLSNEVENNLDEWIKDEMEYSIEMVSLNNDVQGQLLTNAENRHKTAFKEIVLEGKKTDKNQMRADIDYIENNLTMIDTFINMGHKNIKKDLK